MKKIFFSLFLIISIAQATLINGIAVVVNDDPITLYDIDTKMAQMGVSKQQAVEILIDEALYLQSLKKYNISVDFFDIDNYIEKLAKINNMSLFEFKNAIKQQQDYNKFKQDVKNRLKHQKLIQAIASNKITRATEDDLKIYYNNNKTQFQIAKTIEAIHYASRNKKALQMLMKNPMMVHKDVKIQNVTLTQSNMSPQMKFIVNKTNKSEFSAIFAENRVYNMLFIKDKKDIQEIPFVDVKDKIFNIVMQEREKEFLKSYFETLKLTADIKVLR